MLRNHVPNALQGRNNPGPGGRRVNWLRNVTSSLEIRFHIKSPGLSESAACSNLKGILPAAWSYKYFKRNAAWTCALFRKCCFLPVQWIFTPRGIFLGMKVFDLQVWCYPALFRGLAVGYAPNWISPRFVEQHPRTTDCIVRVMTSWAGAGLDWCWWELSNSNYIASESHSTDVISLTLHIRRLQRPRYESTATNRTNNTECFFGRDSPLCFSDGMTHCSFHTFEPMSCAHSCTVPLSGLELLTFPTRRPSDSEHWGGVRATLSTGSYLCWWRPKG